MSCANYFFPHGKKTAGKSGGQNISHFAI